MSFERLNATTVDVKVSICRSTSRGKAVTKHVVLAAINEKIINSSLQFIDSDARISW